MQEEELTNANNETAKAFVEKLMKKCTEKVENSPEYEAFKEDLNLALNTKEKKCFLCCC